MSMLDKRLTKELSLEPIKHRPLSVLTGTDVVPLMRIDSVELGPISINALEFLSVDLAKTFSLARKIFGILGQNVLSEMNYLLDYERGIVELEEHREMEEHLEGVRLSLERRWKLDFIHGSSTRVGDEPMRFMLDSGSAFVVVFERPPRRLALNLDRHNSRGMIASSSLGRRHLRTGCIPELLIGAIVLRHLPVMITSVHDEEDRYEDGILPTRLFRRVYFNHRKGYVMLDPRLRN